MASRKPGHARGRPAWWATRSSASRVGWRMIARKARWRRRGRSSIASCPEAHWLWATTRRIMVIVGPAHEVGDRDPGRVDEGQRVDALGMGDGQLGGDEAAHRVADEVDRPDAERRRAPLDAAGVVGDRDVAGRASRTRRSPGRSSAITAALASKERHVLQPVLPRPAQAVDEHHRGPGALAERDDVDPAGPRRARRSA